MRYSSKQMMNFQLDTMPLEILENIGMYLVTHDYLSLRLPSRYNILPLVQTTTLQNYQLHPHCSHLNLDYLNQKILSYVIKQDHVGEFIRAAHWIATSNKDNLGSIALSYAAEKGLTMEVNILLQKAYHRQRCDSNELFILSSANGHLECVTLLHQQFKDTPTEILERSLSNAAKNNHVKIVKYLLLDPRVTKSANSVLLVACRYSSVETVHFLLELPCTDPSVRDNLAFRLVCKEMKSIYLLRLLLKDKRVDPSCQDQFAIRFTSQHGASEFVAELLGDQRVDPSALYNESIRYASKAGHTKVVELLLKDSRVDPTAENNFAIRIASSFGFADLVQLLLQHGADPSAEDNYAIQFASQNGHLEVVKILLQDGRVDPGVNHDFTVRMASKHSKKGITNENRYAEIVSVLLKHSNVDPSSMSNFSLRYAAQSGNAKIVKMLLCDNRVDPQVLTTAKRCRMDAAEDILRWYPS
jgi:ankyrin repeat protein